MADIGLVPVRLPDCGMRNGIARVYYRYTKSVHTSASLNLSSIAWVEIENDQTGYDLQLGKINCLLINDLGPGIRYE